MNTKLSILIILSLLLLLTTPLSFSLDTLTQGHVITDGGDPLVSATSLFELAFFSPGNSTSRYLGILYRNTNAQSVIWVANRDTPLTTNSPATVSFAPDGNLLLLDNKNITIWSTNITVSDTSTYVKINDTGQLILYANNGTAIWDSFNDVTDTFLPGMRLSLDKNTGAQNFLRAWKTESDPSFGKYSLGLDPTGSNQIFIWKGTRPRWRSGLWDKNNFIGSAMRSLSMFGFTLDNEPGSMSYSYQQYNTTLIRFVMQWDGIENTTMLDGATKEWTPVWVQPQTECETYAKCGANGICTDGNTPICSCLGGFTPRVDTEWNSGNWSGGCVRRTKLGCERNVSHDADGFLGLQEVKVPDSSTWDVIPVNEADCRSTCAGNCSCVAYSYVDTIGCLVWGSDLVDVYQFPQGKGGKDFYVKVAASELGSKSNTKIWKTIVITVSAAILILIILCTITWWKCNASIKDWWRGDKALSSSISSLFSTRGRVDLSGASDYGIEAPDGNDTELPLFSFDFIASATNNFDESNKLGEGGFGDVYKGVLPGGKEVAIKRLSQSSGQGQQEFKNEMILIAKLQHRNLVRLLGCCIQGEEKMLVYEYMPNKSLDAFLFDPERQALLDWKKRFDIIEGIARGLVYLHRDSRLRIVHRDLKASNILLDEGMKPKISDFGMARIFSTDQNQDNTNRVVGTFGYMSPEYAMEGLFSAKSDVYSFGVLILEIVSGRRNNSFHNMPNIINIIGYTWGLWSEDRLTEMIDPTVKESCSMAQVFRCIHVGLLCVQDHANDRPEMHSIVVMLASEAATLPTPQRPTFALERSPNRTETLRTMDSIVESYSVDEKTITVVVGR